MDHIIYNKEGGIARIKFNRPDVLNAYNEKMLRELKSTLEEIVSDDEVKVIIVSGEGRAFSAGVDLKDTDPSGFQKGGDFMEVGKEVGDLLNTMSKVTIAQVHGYCFTGALELMLFFDIAYSTHATQFGDTHTKWAIIPRWGMTQRLARRVGITKAKELTFRAMRIKGEEAAQIGLVARSFPDENLATEVNKIAEEILSNSHEAIKKIKELYNQGWATTLEKGLAIEYNSDTQIADTGDNLKQFESKKFSN